MSGILGVGEAVVVVAVFAVLSCEAMVRRLYRRAQRRRLRSVARTAVSLALIANASLHRLP